MVSFIKEMKDILKDIFTVRVIPILHYSAVVDLYHTAAILSPRRTKSFVFAHPASHWMRGETGKMFCFSIAW